MMAGSSSSSSSSSTSSPTSTPADKGLIATLVAWYLASVVCTNTSKSLGLPWQWLTLAQLMLGSLSAYFGIAVLQLNNGTQKQQSSSRQQRQQQQLADLFPLSPQQWQSTTVLAGVFVGGFVTLNMALHEMDVATVMTIRAAEPVATLVLGLYFLPQERTPTRALLSLIPVVLGAAMASTAPSSTTATATNSGGSLAATSTSEEADASYRGFLLVLLCNCFFACRTIFTKRLKATYATVDNFTLFFQLCVIGTSLQLSLLCLLSIHNKLFAVVLDESSFTAAATEDDATGVSSAFQQDNGDNDHNDSNLQQAMVLLVNGVSFYAYLQLSWVVMSQVGAVTHSVCNALRRPVICAAGWILFGGASVEGVVGALLATLGTLGYAQAKLQAAAAGGAITAASKDSGAKEEKAKLRPV